MFIFFLLFLPSQATEVIETTTKPIPVQEWILERTPNLPPGVGAHGSMPTIDMIREQMSAGDEYGALRTARRLIEHTRSREERHVAHLVTGLLYRRLGFNNLASESFTKVRVSKRALAHWGAFFEAEQDFIRGKPNVSLKECRALNSQYPQSGFRDACTRIELMSLGATGKEEEALARSVSYDKKHPYSLVADKIRFHGARWLLTTVPKKGLAALKALTIRHKDPIIGKASEDLYESITGIPFLNDPSLTLLERQRYALSLKESGRKSEGWTLFEQLNSKDELPPENIWALQNELSFAWQAKEYNYLVNAYQKRYAANPEPMTAWRAMSSAWRAGNWDSVRSWLKLGLETHSEHRKWRRSNEQIGRVWMLGRDYQQATPRFDALAKRSGSRGRRGQFLKGFAAYMHGEDAVAIQIFTELIHGARGDLEQYRYWRIKASTRSETNTNVVKEDTAWILKERPNSWYAFLLRHRDDIKQPAAVFRTGQWSIQDTVEPVPLPSQTEFREDFITGPPTNTVDDTPHPSPFSHLTWPFEPFEPVADAPSAGPHLALFQDPKQPSQHYNGIIWYDQASAHTFIEQLASQNQYTWPRITESKLLANAGLYDWSAVTYGAFYNEYENAVKNPEHPRHHDAQSLKLESLEWKSTFYYTRDAYNGMRHNYGTWKHIEDPKNRRDLERLHWPLAYGATVWKFAKMYGVDPYLVLAIMRAESRYDTFAVSKAGAKGPMQIMPRTGRLLALRRMDTDFDVTQLHYPATAIDYGTEFLGLLLARFGGAFHLAIASYNGGPFAVSSWLKGTGHDMPIDEWVEHILYDETRRYVKRVSMYYEEYLRLYEAEHTHISFPKGPYQDDKDIVDF